MNSLVLATIVALTNNFGSVSVDTVGAFVLSYIPKGGREVFFRQFGERDVKGWYNGGVPICWPWFNRQGDPGTIPHGFVRTSEWTLVDCVNGKDESKAIFRLEKKDNYRLDYEVVLNRSLSLKLVMCNLGKERFVVTTGLHPYFAVSNPSNVTVKVPGGKIDCVPGMDGGRKFGEGTYEVTDKGTGRKFSLKMFGNNKLILWNIGPDDRLDGMSADDWKHYICVEPAVIPRADGFYLNPSEVRSIGMVCTVSE